MKGQKYQRAAVLTIDEVFPYIGEKEHTFVIAGADFPIKMRSLRYKTFKEKGVVCVRCGAIGDHFAIERSKGQTGRYHLNLYATLQDGSELLMTRDHTIPTAKGGENTVENQEPMCVVCNGKKADKL